MRRLLLLALLAAPAWSAEPSKFTLAQSGGSAADPLTVLGPDAVCADNQVARFDGASATKLQCSAVTVTDAGQVQTLGGVYIRTGEALANNIAFQAGSLATGYFLVGNDPLTVLSSPGYISVLASNISFYTANKGIEFEGASDDAFEVVLTGEDATADRLVKAPDADGVLIVRQGIGRTYSMADATPVNLFSVVLATADTACVADLSFAYFATDTTDTVSHMGRVSVACTNDDGTVACTTADASEVVQGTGCAAGCDTWTGSAAGTTWTETASFNNSLTVTGSLTYNVLFSTCSTMAFSP